MKPFPGKPLTGRVLIVDDNEINRDLLAQRLEWMGLTTNQADNGVTALRALQAELYDLVLLDIMMPELNGYDVLERMQADEHMRHVPVIMISAVSEIDSVVRCIKLGAADYLAKPFNPVLLEARINACLEKKYLRDQERNYLIQIDAERRRVDELLHVILPAPIVTELKQTNAVKPRRHEDVAVLFCDIVGFTAYCDRHTPEETIHHLQAQVEHFEQIASRHGLQKIKTSGDAIMLTNGLLEARTNPVHAAVLCGLELVAAAPTLPAAWHVRVGIHVGPVIAGVVGRQQYLFDVWGDTVNVAARVEENGLPDEVHLSASAWQAVAPYFYGESRGTFPIKGKGALELFHVLGPR